ncbi:restriction endonuclease subunit S [Geobacillus sp. 46C-IIa]|uniref:restriction endonuclease subunit S n=1 Tax=Geobacillus sp. 46C-IIa TaxID=1963025 RepID=UPI0009BDA7BC|nr:restriction endonuclease subunit S [Geobacillus sp. 46C-IIa]OQP06061.1 restriction endonuclease subunit S [Geobacillus sp. 46C-IIa]QNU28926.1 restriction endonuclease subunit S [Geobacillus sp. 46C-IIa]WJQ15119.1 restriction endonuclease subunit S [Geobacillus stearothermophilus]
MRYDGWKETRLIDVIDINPRTPLRKGTLAKKVSMQDVAEFTRKIQSYEIAEFTSGSKFKNGDTLLARITPCLENGKTAYVDILEDNEIAFGSTEFIVLRAKEGITDSKFVYYLAISPEFRNIAIKSMTGSSGRQRVQSDVLVNTVIDLPPLEEQKRIANVLSAIDDKIELNNEINQTLEELAQTIFKRWFVDFEFPNENGEPYKSSGGKFVESKLGMIPEGWRVATIGDLGDVVGGGTPSKKREDYFTQNGIPWITPKDLSNSKNRYVERGSVDITEEGLKNSSAKLLPKGTVLFSSRAPIGYIAIAKNEVTTNQGFKSVIPHKDIGSEFMFQVLKYNKDLIESRASGTTFKEISGGELKKVPIVLPKMEVIQRYNEAVRSLGELICNNEEEINALISMRDSLLPKLMSGEIRVVDAEREVEVCLQKSS